MLMVVFGAGASYDSAPSYPLPTYNVQDPVGRVRLPLADQLFEDRELFAPILERFPRVLDVVPRLRHLQPGETVESVMEALQAEAATDPRRHRQLAAVRYYLQAAIWACAFEWDRQAARGVTNYRSLLDLIEYRRKPDETVCLVTFNYDTMLEAALSTVELEIRAIGDYVASKAYKVIKLHGSVNWGREVEPSLDLIGAVADDHLVIELIDRAATLKMTDRYHVVNQSPIVRLDPRRPLVPAIAIPVQRKGAFECPAEHLKALDECLPEVHRLLVIGWRATDAPFLDLLHTKGRQRLDGLVVAGKPTQGMEVIGNLKARLDRPREFLPSKGGFTDLIRQHEADVFLRA